MPVRKIKREELLECEKIQSIAFAYPLDTAELARLIATEPDPADPYIGYFDEENTVTACMELPAYHVRYEGHWVPMVGVGAVASLPEYRFGGAVRQMMHAALRQMVEDGVVFSSLYPFSHPYYRRFGYELCQMTTEYEIPIESLSGFRYHGKARMVRTGDAIDGLKAVFDAHFARCNMPVRREERHWKRVLGDDTFKDRIYTYLLEDEEGPSAYVVLAAENDGPNKRIGNVREIAFVRPQGLGDVLGLLYRLAAQYKRVRIHLPDDVPLAALLGESYGLQGKYPNQQMTRVISVEKALALKRHPEGAAYTLRVHDEGIPENDGVFCVRCEGGAVSVRKTAHDTADLTVDVRTLAQLLLGYLAVDEALYKPDVRVEAKLDTLRSVFVKRPVFLTDHF